MKNLDIRQALAQNRIRQWELARFLSIPETSFSRQMRDELPLEKKQEIFSAIEALRAQEVS